MTSPANLWPRLVRALPFLGPGIFCVGYTIGTGAVTKLAAAGAQSGLQLLWALLGGSLLFWALLEACGRYAIITGDTVLHGFRAHLRGGRWLALLILIGVVMGQWTGLPVLVTLIAQLASEGLQLLLPGVLPQSQGMVIAWAAVMLAGVYGLIAIGRYSLLERAMFVLVALMVGGFGGAMWLAWPGLNQVAPEAVSSLPARETFPWPAIGLIGVSVAAPTFLVRALWLKGRAWGGKNVREQKIDALVAAFIIFIVGASVLGCATGALHASGTGIRNPSDAIHALAPAAGRWAAGLFLVGALGAGLSSLIPMAMVLQLLLADYRRGAPRLDAPQFRVWAAVACVVGLAGPVWGDLLLPLHRLASQLAQVFVPPLVVAGILVLLNRADLMGEHRAGFWLNTGLLAALAFSLMVAWHGAGGLARRFG